MMLNSRKRRGYERGIQKSSFTDESIRRSNITEENVTRSKTIDENITKTLTVTKPTVTKRVTTKIRCVRPDGEVDENVYTEESDLSDSASPTLSAADLSSTSLLSPLSDSDRENPAIKVYTDTVESEPVIDRQVQEFEDTLPDGTIVKRRLIKTTQRKTVIKRVVMEGPEHELMGANQDAMMHRAVSSSEPLLTRYTDFSKQDPETTTDTKESEEVLADGTVVKKRVKTTTRQQLTTERTVLAGTLDVNNINDIFKDETGEKVPLLQPL